MNKGECREYNKVLTYHYLKEQDNGAEVKEQMEKRHETALTKMTIHRSCLQWVIVMLTTTLEKKLHHFAQSLLKLNVLGSNVQFLFLFIYPKISQKNLEVACSLAGVKEQTLSGWLCQKKMILMWVDLVENMTAEVALKCLPPHIQDLFMDVDLDSQVSAQRYRQWLQVGAKNKRLLYKGGKVSYMCNAYFLWSLTYFSFFFRLN